MRLYFTGPSGSGKNTVAKLLSDNYTDTDALVEQKAGLSINEIFANGDEAEFRRIEREVLLSVNSDVVATGGGCILGNLEYMKATGTVICLIASPEELYRRLSRSYTRPLIDSEDALRKMLGLRAYAYCSADYLLDTTKIAPEQVAKNIRELVCLKS